MKLSKRVTVVYTQTQEDLSSISKALATISKWCSPSFNLSYGRKKTKPLEKSI